VHSKTHPQDYRARISACSEVVGVNIASVDRTRRYACHKGRRRRKHGEVAVRGRWEWLSERPAEKFGKQRNMEQFWRFEPGRMEKWSRRLGRDGTAGAAVGQKGPDSNVARLR
jgi:hypothetical protein